MQPKTYFYTVKGMKELLWINRGEKPMREKYTLDWSQFIGVET